MPDQKDPVNPQGNQDKPQNGQNLDKTQDEAKKEADQQFKGERTEHAQDVLRSKREGFKEEMKPDGERSIDQGPSQSSDQGPGQEPDFAAPVNPFAADLPPNTADLPPNTADKSKKEEPKKENITAKEEPSIAPINPFAMPEKVEEFEEKVVAEEKVPEAKKRTPEAVDQSKEQEEEGVAPEVLDSEVVSSPSFSPGASGGSSSEEDGGFVPQEDSQVEEFKEDFWAVMEQAGITKRKLLIIGIILVMVLIGFIGFLSGWFTSEDSGEEPGIVTEDPEEIPEGDSSDVPATDADIYGIISGYILGLEYTPIDTDPIDTWGDVSGIQAGLALGDVPLQVQQDFVMYSQILRQMQNAFNTDVYALVDLSVDRRDALNKHLEEIANLITVGDEAVITLTNMLVELQAIYETLITERDIYEANFFVALNELLGETAYQNMEFFVERSQRAIEIKARYNAYQSMQTMLVNSLNYLRPRYDDIATNFDAIIKGVKVIDIPGSDIDAIIRLE